MSIRQRQTIFMGTTKIDPQKTIGEITGLLVRAKARSVSTDYDAGRVVAVSFTLDVAGMPEPVFFRLPCRSERLLKLLRNDRIQTERTAWRQVLRWVEAQCAMIDIGMVQAHEVFMPYAAMDGGRGHTMFQVWESQQKLLTAPETTK